METGDVIVKERLKLPIGVESFEEIRTDGFYYAEKTISVCDTFVHVATKENFYHGILRGIVSYKSGGLVNSNRESGDGFRRYHDPR